jgi:hypothetical protein
MLHACMQGAPSAVRTCCQCQVVGKVAAPVSEVDGDRELPVDDALLHAVDDCSRTDARRQAEECACCLDHPKHSQLTFM